MKSSRTCGGIGQKNNNDEQDDYDHDDDYYTVQILVEKSVKANTCNTRYETRAKVDAQNMERTFSAALVS